MMDSSVSRIADYAIQFNYPALTAAIVHDCKRRVVDTLGCGLGGYDSEPSRIARRTALRASAPRGAYVLGTAHRALPELAAFANGVMTRYLDGNDAFFGASGGGHGSDVIAPVLAAADAAAADGKAVITAITLAYEVFHSLLRGVSMRERGLDHVLYTAVASAVGASKALALNHEQTVHAIALALTPNLPLGATRRGSLSMWKACAAANAGRNGVFAALLAAEGLTAPDKPIEGAHGLRELLGQFELAPFAAEARSLAITQANMKSFLAVGQSQSPITVALKLQPQIAFEDIQSVTIHTYWAAWSESGSEPEKWHPTNRETADHSLPYIVAAVLIDGRFSDDIFSAERLRDPRIHQLTDKIEVREEPEFSRHFPQRVPCRIEIVTKNGGRHMASVEYPRGHVQNPMTDEEVNAKFRDLAARVLPADRIDAALERLWKLDEAPDLAAIFESMRVEPNK